MRPEQAAIALADSQVAGRAADDLLRSAIIAGAHSIHLEPHQEMARVRYRIDGLLHEWGELSRHALQTLTAHFKQRADLAMDENRWAQEGRFRVQLQGQSYQIKLSTLPLATGEKLVLRLLDARQQSHNLASLGVWGETRTRLNTLLAADQGLIVVSGPHHGGVSTTLASIVSTLNHPSRAIASIEDPIEHRLPGVHQLRIDRAHGLDAEQGLRTALATDANTVMIGDLHGRNLTNAALEAAAKGRLLIGGMHSGSMEHTLQRLAGASTEPHMLATALRGVLFQTMVRRLCDNCKVAAKPDAATLRRLTTHTRITVATLQRFLEEMRRHHPSATIQLFAPSDDGCPTCHHTSFKGQVGVFELFNVSPTLQRRLAHHGDPLAMLHQAVREGMMPLLIDGFVKALCGLTTIDEVLKSYKRI